MNNQNFKNAENRGRNVMEYIYNQSSAITEYSFTQGNFDSIDTNFTSASTKIAGEIKYRIDYKSTDKIIVTGGCMLDAYKLKKIIGMGGKPLYIMLFPDGVGYRWWLDELDFSKIPSSITPRKNTTVGSDTRIVNRLSYYLPLNLGHKFTFNKYLKRV